MTSWCKFNFTFLQYQHKIFKTSDFLSWLFCLRLAANNIKILGIFQHYQRAGIKTELSRIALCGHHCIL